MFGLFVKAKSLLKINASESKGKNRKVDGLVNLVESDIVKLNQENVSNKNTNNQNCYAVKKGSSKGKVKKNLSKDTENNVLTESLTWTEPQPVGEFSNEPMLFDMGMLPKTLAEYTFRNAYAINNTAPDFLAVSIVVSLASLIGGSASITPKRKDKTWIVKPTLWGLVIGGPSTYKTPMMTLGVSPLNYAQENVIDVQNFKNEKIEKYHNTKVEREKITLEEQLKSAIEEEDNDRVEELMNLMMNLKVLNNSARNIVTNDATPEALIQKLSTNPLGILIFRDEINAIFVGMKKQGREQERALFLEGFNASGSRFVQERISRENVELDNVHINILGGIQPKILIPVLSDRASGRGDDGLYERFQLAVYPNVINMEYIDIDRNVEDNKGVNDIFSLIAKLGGKESSCFNFSEEAQNVWDKWSKEFHKNVNLLSDDEQAIEIKYPALVAKLSLVFQIALNAESNVADLGTDNCTVNLVSLEMALKWLEYLRSHSAKIRALITKNPSNVSSLLCNLSKLNGAFTKQELGQKDWKYLTNAKDRNEALKVLEEKGYIKLVNNPKKMYLIHPEYK
ncbi:DUF3987 domain-containing protein [Vibrio fluvialis]